MTAYSGTSEWRRYRCEGYIVFGNSALKCTIFSAHVSFCFTSWWIKWAFKQKTDEAFGLNTTNILPKFSFLCASLSFHSVSLHCYFCEEAAQFRISFFISWTRRRRSGLLLSFVKWCRWALTCLKAALSALLGMHKGIIWKGNEAPEQCFHTLCCFLWFVSAEDECGSVQNTSNLLC